MNNALTQPPSFAAEERAPHSSPGYCYVIESETGQSMYFTNRDLEVVITGLPAEISSDDPQGFTPAQIRHSAIEAKDRFEASSTTLTLTTENDGLKRYFLTAAAVRLKAWIIRVQSPTIDTEPLDFDADCIVVNSGILGKFGFRGNTIAVEITPEPFYVEGKVPRRYFSRECGHFLYAPQYGGVGCGLDKELFKFETTIVGLNPAQRIVTVDGQKPDTLATVFNAGHFENVTLGGFMFIAWSAFNGSDTDLKLATWNPELATAQSLKVFHGCDRTRPACLRFDNLPNFGGFARVPNRTPLHGVA